MSTLNADLWAQLQEVQPGHCVACRQFGKVMNEPAPGGGIRPVIPVWLVEQARQNGFEVLEASIQGNGYILRRMLA